MTTKDARSLPSIGQQDIRIKAIKAILDGRKQVEVASLFGVTRQAVGKWVKAFRTGNETALQAKPKGRPKGGYLLPWQVKNLEKLLLQGATTHGWLNNIWTGQRVAVIIQHHFGKKFSASHARRILRNQLGWSSQKPIPQRWERDEDVIESWKTKGFKKIRNATRKRNAHLVFIDETGFLLAPLRRRTYSPRGQKPVIKVSDPHGRISAIAALTVSPVRHRTNLIFNLLSDNANFNSQTIIQFINHIYKRLSNPITILWDSIPIHGSQTVINYLNGVPEIVSEKFPPYTPELNPVDGVWAYIKYGRLANYTPYELTQLRSTVKEELMILKNKSYLLHAFIRGSGLDLGI